MRNPNLADLDAAPDFPKDITASADTAAVATKTANSEQFWVCDSVWWSYNDDPTGGKLTLAAGSTTLLEVDITTGGPGILCFEKPYYNPSMTKGEAMTITLAAGGGTVVGKCGGRVR